MVDWITVERILERLGILEKAKMLIVKTVDTQVCPCCNRNYINYSTKSHGNTYQLDHILGKDKYPIFVVSFYNLVPVCPPCNQHKSNNIFQYQPHPDDDNEQVHFGFDLNSVDFHSC